MADRGSKSHMPIWVRVPVIVALVLVGIVVSSMLLGAADFGRAPGTDHGSGGGTEMTDHRGSPTGASGEEHRVDDGGEMSDHSGSGASGSGRDHGGDAQAGDHG